MDFTIVVPVLNEEQSVERVARGCLAAADRIAAEAGVSKVNVVVVSDGSTDRTVEIARAIQGIDVVVFPENRGYGAAIQRGWAERPAELCGFLDGDGTCDPYFFVTLIQTLTTREADLVLGSRMGEGSRMPRLRRVGNWLFAVLLGLLSRQTITDSASGMRVVRRSALARLGPLPTGLHFTPAMSARALLGELVILEVPMPYAEREGRSKLNVLRDGLRFLGTILSAALFVRPSRITLPLIGILLVVAIAIGLGPGLFYLFHGRLEEHMIYRFLLVALLADVSVLAFCATLVAEHALALGLLHYDRFAARAPWWWGRRGLSLYLWLSGLATLGGAWLVFPGAVSLWKTGSIPPDVMHWSRVVVAAFVGLTFVQLACARLLVALLAQTSTRQLFQIGGEPPST